MKNKKILNIDSLSKILQKYKSKGKKIVLCHGVFDLLHIGHIKHFEEAKSLGDVLIVTVTPDQYVNKGPNRPAFKTNYRLEALASLENIDFVSENKWPNAINTIKKIRPDIYCKGPDYKKNEDDITGKIDEEVVAIKKIGGKIVYTSDITFSSSNILNKYTDVYSKIQKSFIKKIVHSHNFEEIKKMFDTLKKLKVLVIGETIIDQYVFCEALGKSNKEPVLVLRDINSEQNAGGAAAIVRHLSNFCNSITLLSMLGENGEYKEYLTKSLPKNIKHDFIYKTDSPTIIKKRYVDHISKSKSLGVYSINDDQLNANDEKILKQKISKLIPKHDVVIVSDYGHGFISENIAKHISNASKFMSLNAQVNASNIGYHTMDKYKKVDCVIINENELRHELRDKHKTVKVLMNKLAKKVNFKNLVVTKGRDGAILYNKKSKKYYECPAFASKVVDKIGSGDAMLAILSICLRRGFEQNFSLLLGSLAAAQSVETIGNKIPVEKNKILKTIQHLIK